MNVFLVAILCIVSGVVSQDPGGALEGVTDLTVANFPDNLNKGKHMLVEFYAPWCGWCKKLVPEYIKLGAAVGSHPDVMIGKFDATQSDSQDIKSKYGVRGFPTIVLITKDNRDSGIKFTGERTLEGFLSFIKDKTSVAIGGAASEAAATQEVEQPQAGKVLELSPDNFDAIVLNAEHNVFVKFYAPWCGHCKKLVPVWDQLASSVNSAIIAKVDASKHRDLGSKYGVRGFPTLKFFSKSNKSGDLAHKGGRDLDSMKAFVESNAE